MGGGLYLGLAVKHIDHQVFCGAMHEIFLMSFEKHWDMAILKNMRWFNHQKKGSTVIDLPSGYLT